MFMPDIAAGYTDHHFDNYVYSFRLQHWFPYFFASGKVEMKDQQTQANIIETEHKNVQAGSTTKQQGVWCAIVF